MYSDDDSLFGKLESLGEFESHIIHLIQMGKIDPESTLLDHLAHIDNRENSFENKVNDGELRIEDLESSQEQTKDNQ